MRVLETRDTKAMRRLIAPTVARLDPAFERRVRAIVDGVRTGGDRALVRYARRFDRVAPPLEISAAEMRAAAARIDPAIRLAIARAATTSRGSLLASYRDTLI